MNIVYRLLIVLQISGVVMQIIAVMFLWRLRSYLVLTKYIGILFTALIIDQIARFLLTFNAGGACFDSIQLVNSCWLWLAITAGVFRVVAIWMIVLHLLGIGRSSLRSKLSL